MRGNPGNRTTGEKHHRAKLSDARVALIREFIAAEVPSARIVAWIGCSPELVKDIKHGRTRKLKVEVRPDDR